MVTPHHAEMNRTEKDQKLTEIWKLKEFKKCSFLNLLYLRNDNLIKNGFDKKCWKSHDLFFIKILVVTCTENKIITKQINSSQFCQFNFNWCLVRFRFMGSSETRNMTRKLSYINESCFDVILESNNFLKDRTTFSPQYATPETHRAIQILISTSSTHLQKLYYICVNRKLKEPLK